MGFSRQGYWSGLPFRPPGDRLDPGIEPMSPALAGGFFVTEPPRKPLSLCIVIDTYIRMNQAMNRNLFVLVSLENA